MSPASETHACVQYGCGWSAPEGWLNFDASPTLRFERLPVLGRLYTRNQNRFPAAVRCGDIVRGLPVPDASCELVYCSHVLEHLALEDFRVALRNTFRILRPGGVFRLVLPDLRHLARAYLQDESSEAVHRFMREACLGLERRPRTLRQAAVAWLGNSAHLWMWDYASIAPELEAAGFVGVRAATLGDGGDPRFAAVENPERWADALGAQCRRPA